MHPHRFGRTARCACLALGLALVASAATYAGEVPDLVTFMPGTRARSSEVNANFGALRSAVNDNHARLSTVEASQAVSSAALQAVQSALASQDARISSLEDGIDASAAEIAAVRAEMRAPGVVSMSSFAFTAYPGFACAYDQTNGRFAGAAGTPCAVTAPVGLPHGARVTAVRCSYYDWDDGKVSNFALGRRNLDDGSGGEWWHYSDMEPNASTPAHVVGTAVSASGTERVDNSVYGYHLSVTATASSNPEQLQLHGCRIHYEYP